MTVMMLMKVKNCDKVCKFPHCKLTLDWQIDLHGGDVFHHPLILATMFHRLQRLRLKKSRSFKGPQSR